MAFRRYFHRFYMCAAIFGFSHVIVLLVLLSSHEQFNVVPRRRLKLVSSHGARSSRAPVVDNLELDNDLQENLEDQQSKLMSKEKFAHRAIKNSNSLDNKVFDRYTNNQIMLRKFNDDSIAIKIRNNLGNKVFDRYTNNQIMVRKFDEDSIWHPEVIASANRKVYGVRQVSGNEPPITNPKLTVVLSQWRFGSSVIGDLFNQNLEAFYLFEPLWTSHKIKAMKTHPWIRYPPTRGDVSRQIIRELAQCKFNDDFVETYNEWHPHQNRGLCDLNPECVLYGEQWFENFCKTFRKSLVTKIIRIDLEELRPLVEEDKIDLKIIHLVRDPRGAAASRIHYINRLHPYIRPGSNVGRLKPLGLLDHIPDELMYIQEMRENNPTVRGMCRWIRENTKVSPDLLPPWLQGRYHLVKYEDFAVDPLKISRGIYKFVGLPFPKNVEYWMERNTHAVYRNNDVFSTLRNSLEAATHWIVDLSELEIKQIEKECADVIKLLGYKSFDEIKQTS